MRRCAALFAVVLASPAIAAQAEQTPSPAPPDAPATAPASPAASVARPASVPSGASVGPGSPDQPTSSPTPADIDRIKRRLGAETPLRDAALTRPTFRTSVTERADRFDIWKFWGEPDEVAAYVRPKGGSWHHEFQDMVTPDAYKGYGGILGNGEKLQLAATSLAFAGAMKLLGIGVQQAKGAMHNRTVRKAKEEVQRELEAFYQLHPEARPAAPTTPP
jgi:hypothetical protein